MSDKICLFALFFSVAFVHAQTSDSVTISYTVDTIAAPNCYQSGDGAILLDNIVVPGTIDRYEWSNGATNKDLIYVNGGSYRLTVYNTEGAAFKTEEFFIPEPNLLKIRPFISSPTAVNLDNGFIDFTIEGGTAPFQLIMVFNQDTTMVTTDSTYTLGRVDTGAYFFSVLDAHGCADSTQFVVSAKPCEILVTALVEPAECETSPTGRIELLIDDAVEPYHIDWTPKQSNRAILYNLSAGIYHFTISDRRKCTVTDSLEIKNEDRIPPKAVVQNNILLYLNAEGKATVTTSQALIGARDECHNDLTFGFDKSTFTCDDLGSNNVNFYISDGVGNTTTKPIQIEVRDTQSVKLIYQDTVRTALCNGVAQYNQPRVQGSCSNTSTSGIVKTTTREITASGTYVDRYYYVKKPGDTLRAEVTVIVANTRVRSFLIVEEPQCSTGDDGSIAVALRNSKQPVTYQWNDGSDKDFIYGIVNQEEYRVTVTEGQGCVFELSAFIEGPGVLQVGLQEIIEKQGTIDIIPDITGGNFPIRFQWYSEGKVISESENLLNVKDGKQYQLKVTDARGCINQSLIVDRTMTSSYTQDLENKIDIFPNPASANSLFIRFREDSEAYAKIRVINGQHQVLQEVTRFQDNVSISLKSFPPGLYFIQFFRKEGVVFSKKFIRL